MATLIHIPAHAKYSPQRQFINRREVSDLTGIAIPTLNAMAREKRGPVCRIPVGFSVNMYSLQDVLDWLDGKPIPPWPDVPTQQPRRSKRGKHLLSNRGPGRPRKRPTSKAMKAEGDVS